VRTTSCCSRPCCEVRFVLIHPKAVILPELGGALGRYAQEKLEQRKVEIVINTRVDDYADGKVKLDPGEPIATATLIWTAGVTPGPVIADLDCKKENGRLVVNEFMELHRHPGVWALGDCASAIDSATGKPFPTTAQHAVSKTSGLRPPTSREKLARSVYIFQARSRGCRVQ